MKKKKIFNDDFKMCFFIILDKYYHAEKKIVYQFVKDNFPINKKESYHSFLYLKNKSYVYMTKSREEKLQNYKDYKIRYLELFINAENMLNEENIQFEIEAGNLRRQAVNVISDPDSTLKDIKVAKEKIAVNRELAEAIIKDDSRTDYLERNITKEINESHTLTVIGKNSIDTYLNPIANRFIKDIVRVTYQNGEKKHSIMLKVNSLIAMNDTLRNNKFTLMVDDILIIQDDSILYIFEKAVSNE